IWTGKPAKSDANTKRYEPSISVAQPKPPAPRSDAYVTTGVVLLDPSVQPSSVAPAAQTAKPQTTANPSSGYVSSGVVTFDVPQPRVEPRATPAQSQLQMRLQQRIAAACGKSMEDVKVSLAGQKGVQVRVKARSTQEGETL